MKAFPISITDEDIENFETTTQLNARDVNNRDRANHTGVQAINTVTDLQTALDSKLDDVIAGTNVTIDKTDPNNPVISSNNVPTNPAGTNTQIQYNDNDAFGASDRLTWNETTATFTHKKLASQIEPAFKFLDNNGVEQGSIEHTTNNLRIESKLSTQIQIWSRDNIILKHGPSRGVYFADRIGNPFLKASAAIGSYDLFTKYRSKGGFVADDVHGLSMSGRIQTGSGGAAFTVDNDVAITGSDSIQAWTTYAQNSTVSIVHARMGGSDYVLKLTPHLATVVAEIIQGATGQTANLTEWRDSAGTKLAFINASGNLNLGNIPTSATGLLSGDVWNDAGTLKII